jgi:Aldehyde dehydrogenase family
MKRVTLELGGKSPTILLDDAALDQAIPSALIMAFFKQRTSLCCGDAPPRTKKPAQRSKARNTNCDARLYGRRSSESQDPQLSRNTSRA